jgi:tRNA dimethylallyltransferase
MEQKPKIIVIVGMTATGKSDLAVRLAKRSNGEVVSADSRQVFRGLDLGTGKISKREMREIPHHLLDVADPKRPYSVAHFQKAGRKVIADILKRQKLPIIAGGTGFYIDALVYEMNFPSVRPDMRLRKTLERLATEKLVKRLETLDPKRLETIDTKNRVRLIRAIEIATLYGPVQRLTKKTPYDILWIGLRTDNADLKSRIEKRLKKRIRAGMLKEFARLHAAGLSFRRMEELGLEYRYGARLLRGELSRSEFEKELAKEIRRYAKRQMTWFKKNPDIHWLTPENVSSADALVQKFLDS